MTPSFFLNLVFKHLPLKVALIICLILESSYIVVDRYVYDLTPNLTTIHQQLTKIETMVEDVQNNCKKIKEGE